MNGSKNSSMSIFKIGIIALIGIIAVGIVMSSFDSTSTIEVTQCSLSSNSIANKGTTTITCATENNDKNSNHQITIQFSIQPIASLNFSMGSTSNLIHPNSTLWQYTYTLTPLGTASQTITVQGFLQSGIKNQTPTIKVIFLMDGKQFDVRTLSLTISQ
jgi:hypothetical protein